MAVSWAVSTCRPGVDLGVGPGSHVSVNTDPVEESVGEVQREAWVLRGWAWLGAGFSTTRGSLSTCRRGDSVCACVCARVTPVHRSGRLPLQGLPELGSVQESRERERLGCRVGREAGGLNSGGAGRPSSQDGGIRGGGGRRTHLSVPRVFVQLLLALHVQGSRTGPRSLPPSPPRDQCCGAEDGCGGHASRGLWCV